jgi:hypothetical protein
VQLRGGSVSNLKLLDLDGSNENPAGLFETHGEVLVCFARMRTHVPPRIRESEPAESVLEPPLPVVFPR